MKTLRLLLSASFLLALIPLLPAAEVTLPAAAVIRLGGKTPETYTSGLMDVGKATVGYNGKVHFHCLIGFDLVTVVEDLKQMEDAELTVTFSFNKDPETTSVWKLSVAGITPNLELKNEQAWKLYSQVEGNVGEVPETVKPNDTNSFDVKKHLNPKALSPVNRYIWFRIEEEAPSFTKNTVAGFSNRKEDHTLVLTFNQLP